MVVAELLVLLHFIRETNDFRSSILKELPAEVVCAVSQLTRNGRWQ